MNGKRAEKTKLKVIEWVEEKYPKDFIVEYTRHGNPKPGTDDKADAIVVGQTATKIGETFASNDFLTTFAGMSLNNGPFPNTIGNNVLNFEGVFHYRVVQQCSNILTTSDVDLEFVINSDPDQTVLDDFSITVKNVISALMATNTKLRELNNSHFVEVDKVITNFQGRSGTLR